MRILFLPGTRTSPSARFRVWQFVRPLQNLGHEVEVRVISPDREWAPSGLSASWIGRKLGSARRVLNCRQAIRDADRFDVVYAHKDIAPELWAGFLEKRLARTNPRTFFDFDDAIHLGPRHNKLRDILPHFACVTAGNEFLAGFARQYNKNVSIWPTVVDTGRYTAQQERSAGPPRIGWSGSHHTLRTCFPLLKEIVSALAREREFEFIIIANVEPKLDWPDVKWRFIPWTPETEVAGLQEIDIGVMPLKDEPFERGKCGLKAIQYMALGIPALVSPVGVNAEIVVHGETGFHCRTNEDWLHAFRRLLDDDGLRASMGRAASERVIAHYSVQSLLPEVLNAFEEVRGGRFVR